MLELGISQAQSQFTKILKEPVIIVDKKAKKKKAIILPYKEYEKLLKKRALNSDIEGSFDKFVGILDNDFKSSDTKYNKIIK